MKTHSNSRARFWAPGKWGMAKKLKIGKGKQGKFNRGRGGGRFSEIDQERKKKDKTMEDIQILGPVFGFPKK